MSKMIQEFKKRWKFLTVAYIVFYFIIAMQVGLPNLYYLQPVKIIPLIMAFIGGNALYVGCVERPPTYKATYISVIYCVPAIIVFVAALALQEYLYYHYNIDIGPIIGAPINSKW